MVHKLYSNLVSQFVDQFIEQVHEIHVIMDETPSNKQTISKKIVDLRKLVTSIMISYEKLYGPIEEKSEEEEKE
ncbi:MAG: hypothetical protein ACXADA_17545 [Candidatus Hodarchaeales archaeon]